MRAQWCREHIDETAKQCGLDDETVSRIKKVAKFCASNPQFCDCGTAPIYRLITIPDDPVRQNAISSASKSLESGKHPVTGVFLKDKRLTDSDVKKIIQKAEMEVRGELTEKYKAEQKAKKPGYVGCYQPGEIKTTNDPPQPSLAQQMSREHMDNPATYSRPLAMQQAQNLIPACIGGGACPKMITDGIRGKVCDVLGVPVNQLPASGCPFDSAKGFTPASRLDAAKPLVERPPIRIVKTKLTDQERDDCSNALIERSGFFTDREIRQVDELVSARYEGIKSRSDFLMKAASWFLAQAEGE